MTLATGSSRREERVTESLVRTIALILQRHVKDPRVKDVTITTARVSADLRQARVYFTITNQQALGGNGDSPVVRAAADGLNHASGFIHHELKQTLAQKVVPKLTFHYDDTFLEGARIDALLARIHAEDGTK